MGPIERRGEELRAQVSQDLESLRAMRSSAHDDDEGLGLESGPAPGVLAMRLREHADGEGGGVDLSADPNLTLDLFDAFVDRIMKRRVELAIALALETEVIQRKELSDRKSEVDALFEWLRENAGLCGVPLEVEL